ncbi:MAG TPA: hypothetical protein VN629_01710 [Castellaniella sp.]|nr:hypothetical protein [Castellaniella sp.]
MVVSTHYATLVETQTVLGVQDIYDLIEIIAIDRHNDNLKPRE